MELIKSLFYLIKYSKQIKALIEPSKEQLDRIEAAYVGLERKNKLMETRLDNFFDTVTSFKAKEEALKKEAKSE
jgi:hypothetical protein